MAVKRASSSRVNVVEINLGQFCLLTDFTSKYKLQKLATPIYLKDIVALLFRKCEKKIWYKMQFCEEYKEMGDVLNQKHTKSALTKPKQRTVYRGITSERKSTLIAKLQGHIPESRLRFWENLPTTDNVASNIDDE